ncbi:MAG: type I restriction endonuclease subunit R, partial [Bacteroidota bacterium]
KIDLLFVYNMLLTGFDAPRLKKLYLGRVIKRHNLLQALTRVNRTFKKFRYGYVVDFADIRKEFDATNKAYFDELQSEYGDEIEHYSNLFKSKEEIEEEILDLQEQILHFDTQNLAVFSQQISQISDKEKMRAIVKALDNAKSLYNLIRLLGYPELLKKLDFKNILPLYREANNHLQLLNAKEQLENSTNISNLLNTALEDVVFLFVKIGEEELVLADELKDSLRKTREAFNDNFDQKDPEFISLKAELERLFKKKRLQEVSQEDMNRNIGALRKIHEKIKELNRKNDLLKQKYEEDKKYARIHKRVVEKGGISKRETQIFAALQDVKSAADLQVLLNYRMLNNEAYFEAMMERLVIEQFEKQTKTELNTASSEFINRLVVKEYLDEFHGRTAW